MPSVEEAESAEKIEKEEAAPEGPVDRKRSFQFAFGFALCGAIVWAALSLATGYKIGIVAIVIGMLAGNGAARGGEGPTAQKIGAAAAAFGYFFGQWLLIAFYGFSQPDAPSLIQILLLTPVIAFMILKETFSSINVLFLGIALYEGFQIPSIKK